MFECSKCLSELPFFTYTSVNLFKDKPEAYVFRRMTQQLKDLLHLSAYLLAQDVLLAHTSVG